MATKSDIEKALKSAKVVLTKLDRTCNVLAEDLTRWFEADTLYPDISLDDVLKNRWLVIHEIVEIDAVKKMGLELTKDVILGNQDEVDRAHYEAATVEMQIAIENKDAAHLRDRIPDISSWAKDPRVLPRMRAKYARLLRSTERALKTIESEEYN